MKTIWWTWDIRMRWAHGFSCYTDSYIANYSRLFQAAEKRGVDGVVIWGFLRQRHGGIDAARRIVDEAHKHHVAVYPGFGVDSYGGAFFEGESPWSLDCYLRDHPEYCARRADGGKLTFQWPPTDPTVRCNMCPAAEEPLTEFYPAALEWLVTTFGIDGVEIEQGDNGLCHCERCRDRIRTAAGATGAAAEASVSDAAYRIGRVLKPVLHRHPALFVLWETYSGLTAAQVRKIEPLMQLLPEGITVSWQLYDGPAWGESGVLKIDDDIKSPSMHGCAALRTNNDIFQGEVDDTVNLRRALELSRRAGLDATYLYGEYPDTWPQSARNYDSWLAAAGKGKRG